MGYHEYKGNNNHDFHHTDKCEWCSEYLKRGTGYCLNFTSKNSDLQFIITPFCSPKCYHESIEKGNTQKGNYERVVSDFIEDGGIEKWKIKEKERKKYSEEFLKNHEDHVKITMKKFRIKMFMFCFLFCSGLILLFMKFLLHNK